ncbi:MAG TPA: YqaE/Pmp3 family membrane protein [Sphingomonas sp.]|uniref:YqaE/Pmp3 family membrane protein n=1 Tax=Sphingomonas sp. TaxID=28214 RepID=UPI002CD393E4|nr:YqaE/Pmp3 family membrane protein [Sphingomonas sp.]HMI19783.1 YqaE/Pmp3 family membrane protein [Sphingomonas sp.]
MDRPSVAAVIAAILLPPLGIFLARGLGLEFWIGTLLTALFWVPGILFALAVVLRPTLLARA